MCDLNRFLNCGQDLASARAGEDNTSYFLIFLDAPGAAAALRFARPAGNIFAAARTKPKKGEASIASLVYRGAASVPERHRHRYEVNPDVVPELEKAGLRFVGKDDTNTRMEIVELPRTAHPFYFAAQFHPEFKSRPQNPSPPFFGFVLAAAKMFPAGLAKRKAAPAPSCAKKARK